MNYFEDHIGDYAKDNADIQRECRINGLLRAIKMEVERGLV